MSRYIRHILSIGSALTILGVTLWLQPIPPVKGNQPVKNTAETIEKPDAFNDLGNHWSRHVINWLAGNNPQQISYLKTSEQSFRPGCPIKRGEWVVMFASMLDLKNRPTAKQRQVTNAPKCLDIPSWFCPFSDVPATKSSNPPELRSYYQATFHAWRTGMISGYKDGTFRPERTLTYAEAIASLAGGLNLVAQIDKLKKQSGEKPSIIGTDYFMNGSAMKDQWFVPALHGALLANLVALDWPLEFYPYRPPLSRGEAAVMMYLSLAYQGKASLDDPILMKEIAPSSGEYALRHIRRAGQPNFSFSPPYFRRQCNN
ncbi:MAG: S-layer homology domain-containing protein [Calothrix sp. MO_192.B10]|nr:S-layer homology domain-containing protein [Calothrix sp. MO_192.B10]